MTDWKIVHDSRPDEPPLVDTTSSRYTVYVRRNVEQVTVEPDMEGLESYQEWVYEQMTYTQEEYALLTGPATQATMQSIAEQTAAVTLAGVTNQQAVMQAINQQTAELAAAVVAAQMGG